MGRRCTDRLAHGDIELSGLKRGLWDNAFSSCLEVATEFLGQEVHENPGPTWFRRGYRSSTVHTEAQPPRKSNWKTTNANDERFALAA